MIFRCFLLRIVLGLLILGASWPLVREARAQSPVQLTIDSSVEHAPISPYLYGVNIANWCAWYYLNQVTPMLKEAGVTVVRLGATNMERYNFQNNRMFNAVALANQYIPLSWRSFIDWTKNEVGAEPFLQASVFGHVAGEGQAVGQADYDRVQVPAQVQAWAEQAGADVKFWGIGNEPFIAWKRHDYPGIYSDLAHGDQVLNYFTSYDYYFNRFTQVARALKDGQAGALTLGPTPANWFLYWSNEYSPFCPVTTPNGPAMVNDAGWATMSDPVLMWDPAVFPDRGQDPSVTGWETDSRRVVCQFLSRMNLYGGGEGRRLADYLDVHRYIQAIKEFDAVQEPRGLWQDDFQSWDLETLYSGIQTRILKRFRAAVDQYYPGTGLAFSEYGYFYWSGHPSLPQNAAIGLMDFLGFFSRGGVDLACNWYVGEPNQSAGDFAHGVDSARQAMFDEQGRPNPKFWVFYVMSRHFHGTSIQAESSDWDRCSVHAGRKDNGDVVVVAAYKGEYDPVSGDLLANQGPRTAVLTGLPPGLGLTRLFRVGLDDPVAVEMVASGLGSGGGAMGFTFQPLAVYLFEFSATPPEVPVTTQVLVQPQSIHFGPYDSGWVQDEGGLRYTQTIKITNATLGSAAWSVDEDAPWLDIAGSSSGAAQVTDLVRLTVDRQGLDLGAYETEVQVTTSEGEVVIPVSMSVIPGQAGGEKRLSDFETGSLAHTWNISEPYAVGWWDGHGGPEDLDSPYIYRFFMDHQDLCRLGDSTSMKIDFDRQNGDTENGRLYLPFGTYGHQTTSTESGASITYGATGNWSGYDSFQLDIKTDTKEEAVTELELVFSDVDGHRGKPDILVSGYDELIPLDDGMWQTIIVPLDAVFFNWAATGGQDGSTVKMNFEAISQIEIIPWRGDGSRAGTIFLDNLRVVKATPSGNRFPLARTAGILYSVAPGQPVYLDGTPSVDPDGGTIAKYQWLPADNLSDPNSSRPVFQTDTPGTYTRDLVVFDEQGLASRNIVQVLIQVGQGGGGETGSGGGAGVSGGCFLEGRD